MAFLSFDGPNRQISVTAGGAVISVGSDIYSGWKEWVQVGSNAAYLPAVRTFGGDPTSGGQFAPQYFFLINGWRILVDGLVTPSVSFSMNIYTEEGDSPFVQLNGATVYSRVSDAVIVSDGGGGGGAEVLDEQLAQHNQAGTVGEALRKILWRSK